MHHAKNIVYARAPPSHNIRQWSRNLRRMCTSLRIHVQLHVLFFYFFIFSIEVRYHQWEMETSPRETEGATRLTVPRMLRNVPTIVVPSAEFVMVHKNSA